MFTGKTNGIRVVWKLYTGHISKLDPKIMLIKNITLFYQSFLAFTINDLEIIQWNSNGITNKTNEHYAQLIKIRGAIVLLRETINKFIKRLKNY